MLLNVPVNNYGHVGTTTSYLVGLLPDIEMNNTSSPAIKHRPSKQQRLIYRGGPTYNLCILDRIGFLSLRKVRNRIFLTRILQTVKFQFRTCTYVPIKSEQVISDTDVSDKMKGSETSKPEIACAKFHVFLCLSSKCI